MDALLKALPVLVLDCQATGPNPTKGHLLEMAWCHLEVDKNPKVTTHQLALPPGVDLTVRIAALTGLTSADLKGAGTTGEAWQALISEAANLGDPPWPLVIHFARYELPFLKQLHRDHGSSEPFPFRTICTHEIASRLLPGLPRKGLRAVAGYLGHHLEEHKRAADHVRATVFIWREFVQRLEDRRGVRSHKDLTAWLAREKPKKTRHKSVRLPSAVRSGLPDTPGVYRLLGKGGQVLYVGKAASIKSRVSAHFTSFKKAPEKNLELYSQVWDISTKSTPSALEAAVLEVDQIATHAPPYNLALKTTEQRVWFCTTDLSLADSSPNGACRFGPLPAVQGVLSAGAIGRALVGGSVESKEVFQGPEKWRPDDMVFSAGIERFRANHGRPTFEDELGPWVLRLGARLDRLRQADGQPGGAKESLPEDREPVGDRLTRWTADRVMGALEGVVRHGAALVRRGLWLVRLSEASLAWQVASGGERLIQIDAGEVAPGLDWDPGQDLPNPPGATRGILQRQRLMNRLAHDHLRVLTTELRRLATQGRRVRIRLGERWLMDEVALAHALKRV